MLVWVVLHEVVRFSEEGFVLDRLVGVSSVHKSLEKALEFADEQNNKLIDKQTKVVTMVDGQVVWTNHYVDKTPVYLVE